MKIDQNNFRLGSFATGDYLHKCIHCKEEFMGDKRAVTCLKCSLEDVDRICNDLENLRKKEERFKKAIDGILDFKSKITDQYNHLRQELNTHGHDIIHLADLVHITKIDTIQEILQIIETKLYDYVPDATEMAERMESWKQDILNTGETE